MTIVNGVISIISFSTSLSFQYGKATDLFELIFYPTNLLKLFIMFKSSVLEFLGSLMYIIISSANSDTLISSFPICIPLTSFYCLITLARTWSTILNRRHFHKILPYVDQGIWRKRRRNEYKVHRGSSTPRKEVLLRTKG